MTNFIKIENVYLNTDYIRTIKILEAGLWYIEMSTDKTDYIYKKDIASFDEAETIIMSLLMNIYGGYLE